MIAMSHSKSNYEDISIEKKVKSWSQRKEIKNSSESIEEARDSTGRRKDSNKKKEMSRKNS